MPNCAHEDNPRPGELEIGKWKTLLNHEKLSGRADCDDKAVFLLVSKPEIISLPRKYGKSPGLRLEKE